MSIYRVVPNTSTGTQHPGVLVEALSEDAISQALRHMDCSWTWCLWAPPQFQLPQQAPELRRYISEVNAQEQTHQEIQDLMAGHPYLQTPESLATQLPAKSSEAYDARQELRDRRA